MYKEFPQPTSYDKLVESVAKTKDQLLDSIETKNEISSRLESYATDAMKTILSNMRKIARPVYDMDGWPFIVRIDKSLYDKHKPFVTLERMRPRANTDPEIFNNSLSFSITTTDAGGRKFDRYNSTSFEGNSFSFAAENREVGINNVETPWPDVEALGFLSTCYQDLMEELQHVVAEHLMQNLQDLRVQNSLADNRILYQKETLASINAGFWEQIGMTSPDDYIYSLLGDLDQEETLDQPEK